MKKHLPFSVSILAVLLLLRSPDSLIAQTEPITVPDYAYGEIHANYGLTSSQGVAKPTPYGSFDLMEYLVEKPSDVFLAHGYRSWGYPETILLICTDLPLLNYPGYHGVWDMSHMGCSGEGIQGHMNSWGGIIAEPANQKIWSLVGAMNEDNGPTVNHCIGLICYPPPSSWGSGNS